MYLRLAALLLFSVVLFSGCDDERTADPIAPGVAFNQNSPDREEEIFGNLYENGQEITSSSYYVMLRPHPETRNRIEALGYADYDSIMWVKPDKHVHWMWGWVDIQSAQGGCEPPRVHRRPGCVSAGSVFCCV